MKSLFSSIPRRSSCLLMLGRLAVIGFIFVVFASAEVLAPDELYQQGLNFYQQDNYLKAAEYLFAYLQVAANLSPDFRQKVVESLEYSELKARLTESVTLDTRGSMTNPHKPELPQRPMTTVPGAHVTTEALPTAEAVTTTYERVSYPLVCRGGGNMQFGWEPFGFGLVAPFLDIRFEKAQQGANTGSLGLGQCSWLDRAIASNEPSDVCASFESSRFSIHWDADGMVHGIASTAPKFVGDLLRVDGSVTFDAYNNGNGCLVAKWGGE